MDTGSSNTWIGADKKKKYQPSSSSTNTHDEVVGISLDACAPNVTMVHQSVSYGSGFFVGIEYMDTVKLGGLRIEQQSFGVAKESESFEGVDGILG